MYNVHVSNDAMTKMINLLTSWCKNSASYFRLYTDCAYCNCWWLWLCLL